ncbi:MAG: DUF1232 domain-containing protein [Pirellulales bacterium]|nr:DUF1232 domain-containing protein [Pirellulales bacterium]
MGIMQVIGIFIICGTILLLALMVLVAIPQSRLRDVLLQVVGWLFAGGCAAYVLSPVDVVPEVILGPFGLVDDLIALIVGIGSAVAAWQVRRRAGRSPVIDVSISGPERQQSSSEFVSRVGHVLLHSNGHLPVRKGGAK